jgi:hypothetical protein
VSKRRNASEARWTVRAANAARAGLLIGDAHRGGRISDDAYDVLARAVASEIDAVTGRLIQQQG